MIVAMRLSEVIFLISLQFSISFAYSVTFPLDREILRTPCESEDGEIGVYKLVGTCDTQENDVRGFIRAVGAVVCCPSKEKLGKVNLEPKSESYCSKFGAEAATALDFNVVEGERSEVGEFPFFAAIGYVSIDGDTDFDCGGALVSERFVLTAAHCSNLKGKQPSIVRLGRTSLDLNDARDPSDHKDVKIKRVILPDDYTARLKYNDIALLELVSSVTFSDNIKPICLFANQSKTFLTDYNIAGFGIENVESRSKSNWLIKGRLKGISTDDCYNRYKDVKLSSMPQGIKDTQVCAVGVLNTDSGLATDTCQGDSGSPLTTVSSSNLKYYLFGVTSFGLGCGSTFPSVYTRISSRVKWIESFVWPN